MKILGTGLTGLVGSRFVELFESVYEFSHINLENGIDILDKQSVLDTISSSDAGLVIHMAAKTNVDGCELDKEKDKDALGANDFIQIVNDKTAWAVNVLGTKNIIEACKKTNKKLIYISTDFVFDGAKKSFTEENTPNPINWYAKTKYEGEKLVQNSGLDYIIVRLAYPYRACFKRSDFVRGLISKLEKGEKLEMITDHIMVPTFIDDIVNAIGALIEKQEKGIFHVVGSQPVTPYDAALKIAKEFDLDSLLISKTTRRKYFAGKAPRPFCLNLKNDKISNLGIEMSSFDKGLTEIKHQIERIHI
ncbi:MAG: SDR family oxidoreductase [Patescibacteria group bacterium]|nr:SDR family oxidoreductase [Patescibacteria group bacterium]